jgi:acyl-CoA ligase (AMP-forming) (exosortase A-associated)
MTALLHDLILKSADRNPDSPALTFKTETLSYAALAEIVINVAGGLTATGLERQERVAVYVSKRPETVAAIFAITQAGGVFVPVNPILKASQVVHILADCNVRILITTKDRFEALQTHIEHCRDLQAVVLLDASTEDLKHATHLEILQWESLANNKCRTGRLRTIESDMAAIFYTSGSTGQPKGVVLSHRNMVVGAQSVATYLDNQPHDRLLAVLPLSFDYGFSQLSTTFHTGANVTLMDFLFPRDVINAVANGSITGLAGVPPLWIQLAKLPWPSEAIDNLRYITNSGGAMPKTTLEQLRSTLSTTQVFLMYGLTEAFRSTYLDPDELDRRPESMGKAIPNAEVMVVHEDGTPCTPGEPGELVHRGPLVSLGYWNDEARTAERFRQSPGQLSGIKIPEIAVWSGDTVVEDTEGFLTFVGRRDEMIKTSGYRVSPTEVEEGIYATGLVAEAVAIGVADPAIGQSITIIAVQIADAAATEEDTEEKLLAKCRQDLPNFMVPNRVVWRKELPRNANGKIDRNQLRNELQDAS